MSSRLLQAALLMALASSGAVAQLPMELIGTWRLDNARSNGVPPGMQVRMVVSPHPSGLTIEHTYGMPTGPVAVLDTMPSDGQTNPYTWKRPTGQEGRGLRTVKQLAAELGIEIVDSVSFDTPQGPQPRWSTQKWIIDTAAKTLTQEMVVRFPFVRTPVRNVYMKEPQ